MRDAQIVEHDGLHCLRKRKPGNLVAVHILNGCFTAADIRSADKRHQHEIHAIPVHALRCRLASILLSENAKLVNFHMPVHERQYSAKCLRAKSKNFTHHAVTANLVAHRCKLTLDTTVEGIECHGLKWGPCGCFSTHPPSVCRKGGMSAQTIGAAIHHICIFSQIFSTCAERNQSPAYRPDSVRR